MCTARTLTVSRTMVCREVYLVLEGVLSPSRLGVLSPRGVYLVLGVYLVPGVCLPKGGVPGPGGCT